MLKFVHAEYLRKSAASVITSTGGRFPDKRILATYLIWRLKIVIHRLQFTKWNRLTAMNLFPVCDIPFLNYKFKERMEVHKKYKKFKLSKCGDHVKPATLFKKFMK